MKKEFKIAVVIADPAEYAPVADRMAELGGKDTEFLGNKGITLQKNTDDINMAVSAVLCGIGKVNAAAATAYFATMGYDTVISTGFSGGLADTKGYDAVIGTEYLEHDFDLTVLGYKPAEKPGQEYIYSCDEQLLKSYLASGKKCLCGTMVAGDCFISSDEKRDFFINTYNAVACDMETAAVAAVCHKAGVRFLAIRRVSDNAGDSAAEDYSQTNASSDTVWFAGVVDWILSLTEK
jgi:adenosylhomocysteine nucleosidase